MTSFFPGGGYPSTLNVTSAPLAGGATYEGDWERTPQSAGLVQCFSNLAGTLYIEFSVDGVNADSTFPLNGWKVAAATPEVHSFQIGPGRYFRLKYVNGPSAQTTFRLGAYLGVMSQLSAPLNNPYSLDSDSTIVRPTWTWLDVARELSLGISVIEKFGRNDAIGTSFEAVTYGGTYPMPQSGSATALRIKAGGNANDTAAGTGARQITLEGLDQNFALASETLATAGASASSATTTTFTRLYRAYVSESGSYADLTTASHAGDIVIENSAGGTDWLTINANTYANSQSEVGWYSVPSGYTAYVKLRHLTGDSGKLVDAKFMFRANADDTAAPYSAMRSQGYLGGIEGGNIQNWGQSDVPLGPYVGPCDIGFLAKVSTGTASVSVEFEIILVQE